LELNSRNGEVMSHTEVDRKAEFEALTKLGMRWAVLLAFTYDLTNRKAVLSPSVNRNLRLARAMLESGCFPPCDVNCLLDEVESALFQASTSLGKNFEQHEGWLHLLKKAMNGQLTAQEVRGLPFIKPIINTCSFLKCACKG